MRTALESFWCQTHSSPFRHLAGAQWNGRACVPLPNPPLHFEGVNPLTTRCRSHRVQTVTIWWRMQATFPALERGQDRWTQMVKHPQARRYGLSKMELECLLKWMTENQQPQLLQQMAAQQQPLIWTEGDNSSNVWSNRL